LALVGPVVLYQMAGLRNQESRGKFVAVCTGLRVSELI